MKLYLPTSEHTLRLGRLFATTLPLRAPYPPVLLQGTLGAGKTTFVRGLVNALPDGDLAEVASPSFNLVNHYPTRPPVMHVDLYRLDGLRPDDDLLEALEADNQLILVEWAEHLPADMVPKAHFALNLDLEKDGRTAELKTQGELFRPFMEALEVALKNFQ